MGRAKGFLSRATTFLLLVSFFTACGGSLPGENIADENPIVEIQPAQWDMVPLASQPVPTAILTPVASGTDVRKNAKAEVDASNAKDGYIMVRYPGGSSSALKVLVTGPSKTIYIYNLARDGSYEVFPLSDGNGCYTVGVYKNISGNRYSTEFSTSLAVTLTNEFMPFLYPNQYVNFNADTLAVKKAAELTSNSVSTLDKVEKIYCYVIKNFTYDQQLAKTVKSGYLPDLDDIWDKKSGICFDYAATMTAMLRSQNIPTKLTVGYAGNTYHAWINVYTEDSGWIDNAIYFDGSSWELMDPTFASGNRSSEDIAEYIGNGTNYTAKYLY